MTFSRFLSVTPVLGFLVRNLYKTPHYPPNKTGDAGKLMLRRCLKGFSTTKTLTNKNSGQNDYKTTKISGSINYVTEASLSANCACQPVSTLKSLTIIRLQSSSDVLFTHAHFWLMIFERSATLISLIQRCNDFNNFYILPVSSSRGRADKKKDNPQGQRHELMYHKKTNIYKPGIQTAVSYTNALKSMNRSKINELKR